MDSLFIIVAFVSIGFTTCAAQCPTNLPKDSDLIVNGSKCYEFILHHRYSWTYASEDCTKKGGNLVTIANMEEQNFIMNSLKHLRFFGTGVWIGLNDRVKEGHYQWINGNQPANFTYWAVGQPGSFFGLNEDCVLLMFHKGGHWHDYNCLDEFLSIPEHDGWVCEYGIKQVTDMSPVVPSSTIPTSQKVTTMKATKPSTQKVTTMAVTLKPTQKVTTMAVTSQPTQKVTTIAVTSQPTQKVTTMAVTSQPTQKVTTRMVTTPSTQKVTTMAVTTPPTTMAVTSPPTTGGGTKQPMTTGNSPGAQGTTQFVIG